MPVTKLELEQVGFPTFTPGVEFAARWTTGLRETIKYLDDLAINDPGIDLAKAVRATVGTIIGDGVNPLIASMVFTELKHWTDHEFLVVRNGVDATWLIATGSIQEFAPRLSDPTVGYFDWIFARNKSFIDELESGNLINKKRVQKACAGLLGDIKSSIRAPGMEQDDIAYMKKFFLHPLGF